MSMRSRLRAIGATVAMSLVLAPVVGTLVETPAHASSTIGGTITRTEILQRAQYWVDQHYTYNQDPPDAPDQSGKTYRRDCSGLVSMAWHLDVSRGYLTNEFLSMAQSGSGMHTITLDQLQPGDAVVRDDDGYGPHGHMELFAFWKDSNHQDGAYVYSFNNTGETVQNPYAPSTPLGNIGFDSWSDLNTYQPIRYDNAIDDPVPAQSSGSVVFNGTMYEFARGADHTVKYWFASGGAWSGTQTIGGNIASDPVATVFNGTLYVYAIGTDGNVHYWYANGGAWSSMQTVGGPASGALSATVANGVMYVFARGTDGSVKYWFATGGPWSGMQTIGGSVSGAVASTVFNGTLYVYAIGTDGNVHYWYASGGSWSAMQTVGGPASGGLSASVFNGFMYVFARGTDGSVKYWYANGGPWSSIQTIGGLVSGAVSSTVFNGTLYAYARGNDGTVKYWYATGGPWSSQQTFGSGLA